MAPSEAEGADATEPPPPKPIFWLFLNTSFEGDRRNDDARALVRGEASSWRGRAHFVWLDAQRYEQHAASLALQRDMLPALAADHQGAHHVYPRSPLEATWGETAAARERLSEWVRGVVSGTIPPTLRSASPPLLNYEPLTIVVASTFDELVLEGGVDCLLVVTTEWCAGCDALDAELEALAERWQDEPRVRIARFDAGVNDLPRAVQIDKLPAILYIRAGSSEATALSHLRTERELTDALVRHSGGQLKRPANLDEIQKAIDLLPRLQSETRALLEENARLRDELATLRGAA